MAVIEVSYKKVFIILSIVAIFLVVGLVIFYPGDITTNFASELFATLLGVIIGMSGSQWITSHNQFELEKIERESIINSLLAELDTNLQFHEKNKIIFERDSMGDEVYIGLLTDSGYDSIIFSGNYRLLAPETQRYLTFHYGGVRHWNSLVKIFGEIHTRDPREHIPNALQKNLQKTFEGLNQSFPDVKDKLESELST